MSSEKSGYPDSAPPAYADRDGDVDSYAPPRGAANPPPTYPSSNNSQFPLTPPAPQYGGNFGGNYNTQYAQQYGQQSHVQVVQSQPGMMVVQRNVAAVEQYSGLFIVSIVITLLCCWPIGIFAIQRARQAKTAAELGRAAEAEEHARASKRLMTMSVVGPIGIIVALTVVQILLINDDCYDSGNIC